MSRRKKKLRKALKIGLGLGLAGAAAKFGPELLKKKAIAAKNLNDYEGVVTKVAKAPTKAKSNVTFQKLEKRKSFRHGINRGKGAKKIGLSMEDVKARNEAFNKKLKERGPVERYSMLKSMGFKKGKMIKAKGGKEIVSKVTKLM